MQIYFHPKSVRIPDFPSDYSHILTHPPHILYLLTMCRAYDPLPEKSVNGSKVRNIINDGM